MPSWLWEVGRLQGRTSRNIKADIETAVNILYSLSSKIWEKEEVPAQWEEGISIKLPKKGDLRDCSNYRGIMLLSTLGKVLNRVLLERMKETVDPKFRDLQASFRRYKSCDEQITSLRSIVEESLEWNSPPPPPPPHYSPLLLQLHRLWEGLQLCRQGDNREATETLWVPEKIISLIRCTIQDTSCRMAHAGQLSESFEEFGRGACFHLSSSSWSSTGSWSLQQVGTTVYSRHSRRCTSTSLTSWCSCRTITARCRTRPLTWRSHQEGQGSRPTGGKTELLKMNTTANKPVTVSGEPSGRWSLSSTWDAWLTNREARTETSQSESARQEQLSSCSKSSGHLEDSAWEPNFNSNVKSVLLYGCETWRTTKTMQQKIQTVFNTCLRRIYKIRWQEKIRNEDLWERAGQEPVAKQILRRKWVWIGHTLRKPASSTTRQPLTWNSQGKRKRSRPRSSWMRDTEAELKQQGTNWTGVARAAQNRVRWRGVVNGLCSTGSDGHKLVLFQHKNKTNNFFFFFFFFAGNISPS